MSVSRSRIVSRLVRDSTSNIMSDKHAIRNGKLARVRPAFGEGKIIATERTVELLETVIKPGERIILEGDNQKQGDFLADQLARMNPQKVSGLKLCVSSVGLPEHLDLFENGLATELDFAYAAPQAARLARMVMKGSVKIGDVLQTSRGMASARSASSKASRQASTGPSGCQRQPPRIVRGWQTRVSRQRLRA